MLQSAKRGACEQLPSPADRPWTAAARSLRRAPVRLEAELDGLALALGWQREVRTPTTLSDVEPRQEGTTIKRKAIALTLSAGALLLLSLIHI